MSSNLGPLTPNGKTSLGMMHFFIAVKIRFVWHRNTLQGSKPLGRFKEPAVTSSYLAVIRDEFKYHGKKRPTVHIDAAQALRSNFESRLMTFWAIVVIGAGISTTAKHPIRFALGRVVLQVLNFRAARACLIAIRNSCVFSKSNCFDSGQGLRANRSN